MDRVVPASAHAAFYKAAEYFKIKLHTIPVNYETRQVDLKRLKRAMYVYLLSISVVYDNSLCFQ
jgi:glutamate/tyrosine decarboxylase-like PLP-dependent enzyme